MDIPTDAYGVPLVRSRRETVKEVNKEKYVRKALTWVVTGRGDEDPILCHCVCGTNFYGTMAYHKHIDQLSEQEMDKHFAIAIMRNTEWES